MKKFFQSAIGAVILGVATMSQAATDTTTFQVKIVITESCDIHSTSPTDVDFGTRARSSSVPEATGSLEVLCTTGTTYNITLDNGSNYDTTNAVRRMKNGSNYIAYGLYTSSGTTSPWSGSTSVPGTGTGATQSVPVYGSLVSGASNAPAGTYTDTVTATVTY